MPALTIPERLDLSPQGDVRIVCDPEVYDTLDVQMGQFTTVGALGIDSAPYTHGDRAIVPDPDSFRPLTLEERRQYLVPATSPGSIALSLSEVRIYSTEPSRKVLERQLLRWLHDGTLIRHSENRSAPGQLTTTNTENLPTREAVHVDYGEEFMFRAASVKNAKLKDPTLEATGGRSLLVGTPGTVCFEHLLAWLDQLRAALEDGSTDRQS